MPDLLAELDACPCCWGWPHDPGDTDLCGQCADRCSDERCCHTSLSDTTMTEPTAKRGLISYNPHFRRHAGLEAIDAYMEDAEKQRDRWATEAARLAELRDERQAQIAAGTWPPTRAKEATDGA